MERWKKKSLDYISKRFFLWHPASTGEPARQAEFCILGRELRVFQMLIHTYSAMVSSRKKKKNVFRFFQKSDVFQMEIFLKKMS